jgi:hypothetical protein
VLKENICKPRLFYPEKSFIIEEEMKTSHDKQNLKQFMSSKPVQPKIHKGILNTEQEDKGIHENK